MHLALTGRVMEEGETWFSSVVLMKNQTTHFQPDLSSKPWLTKKVNNYIYDGANL